MKKYLLAILIFVLAAAQGFSGTRITLSTGRSPKWSTLPVSYWINERGCPQILNGSDFDAIHASFRTWANVTSADVRFNYRGTTTATAVGRDGINMISFSDSSTPLGSATIAVTYSFFRTDRENNLLFDESDIIFSTALPFSTSGETDKFDIQSVLTHEIGHLLGLDHSGLISSVMVPFSQPSQVHQRTLAYDDIAGISEIYPRGTGTPSVGQIQGVLRAGSVPVFGAHVVAVDQTGTDVVSALSQPDGSYTLRFLPPAAYKIYAEPLDQPVTESNVGGNAASWYRNLKTDFGSTYAGNVSSFSDASAIEVFANSISTSPEIQVLPRNSTGLNLARPAFANRVARGSATALNLGGVDVTAGTFFEGSSLDLFLGFPRYATQSSSISPTLASLDLTVPPTTPLGPKNITVRRGADTSIVSGAVVVVETQPTVQLISPNLGPLIGGTDVTISGSNFRSDARVYFAGLPAASMTVVDSNLIRATTPRNSPGLANVQVINGDGTNGLIPRGFTFTPPNPSADSITPSSGPPTTVVTIEGTQFDTRIENLEVRFSGTAARIVSATSTSIVAVVPYGAISGPVSVSVFGIQARGGPTFEVKPPDSSTNHPIDAYNFIDSTPTLGGTNLTFIGPFASDDGLTTIQLPFLFSLFNTIYLKGSSLTVSTNGWISLENVQDIYTFLNAKLPASSAVDASGSVRTIPPSLIAPFHDDLVLVPNVSSITTRVVGSAPNRQLVIQWSRMHILDETGLDVNATVTFQAILFEGSNDIQFLYESASGPRSDASSATIGLQNVSRDKAVLTSYNQSKIKSSFSVTYRFNQGTYVTADPDPTPPTRPVVIDSGTVTRSRTELFAAWSASDPDSGIREYQYAIGKAAGATDVLPFTGTPKRSVVVTGLNLDPGTTYFFTVRAVNNAGVVSEPGVSDGIRVDTSYEGIVRVVPSSAHTTTEFSGVALYSSAAMTVVLKAIDASGNLITGAGLQNPTAVVLSAGQQSARLISELFGISAFDGWIEIEAPTAEFGVYATTGAWDGSRLEGSIVRGTSTDFVLMHVGATATLVNPSTRVANLTVRQLDGPASQSLSIAPRSKASVAVLGPARVQSSEPLGAIERFGSGGKLAVSAAQPISSAQPSLVIPGGVTGLGNASTLTLVNVAGYPVEAMISFGGASRQTSIAPNASMRLSLASFLQLPANSIRTGAVRVTGSLAVLGAGSALLGALDIENDRSIISIDARSAAVEGTLPYVVQGSGFYTGICLATGTQPANVTIEVYSADGGTPKSAKVTVAANEQVSKLLSELVPAVTSQIGGYIRIRSDQPIWTWAIYGSALTMTSGPPL